jgi:hypothetical protein
MADDMILRKTLILLLFSLMIVSCRQETAGAGQAAVAQQQDPFVALSPEQRLAELHPAIPIYPGAGYNADLTRRDSVTVQREFGQEAEVFTLATNDSFPKVYHYYVTYLSQYRAYDPPRTAYPSARQAARSLELHLDDIMLEPFIPADQWLREDRNVILRVNESDTPNVTIRYILTPKRPGDPPDPQSPDISAPPVDPEGDLPAAAMPPGE